MEAELQKMYNCLFSDIVNSEDNGKAVIEGFRQAITKHKCIESGKHFNMRHLSAAQLVCRENLLNRGKCSGLVIFWRKVVGFLQSQMPANYANAFCSGVIIRDRTSNNEDDSLRTLSFHNGEKKIFPLSKDSVGLGFDFAVYSAPPSLLGDHRVFAETGDSEIFKAMASGHIDAAELCFLSGLVEQKQKNLLGLSESLSPLPTNRVTL